MTINDFGPCNADVWGTVAEWAAVVVYFVTFLIIRRTLISQQEVQRAQQKITEISIFQHRQAIMPRFKFVPNQQIRHYEKFEGNSVLFNRLPFSFKLGSNAARDVKLPFDQSNSITRIPFDNPDFINAEEQFVVILTLVTNTIGPDRVYWWPIKFELFFSDIELNQYKQIIEVTITNDTVTADEKYPIPVEVEKPVLKKPSLIRHILNWFDII